MALKSLTDLLRGIIPYCNRRSVCIEVSCLYASLGIRYDETTSYVAGRGLASYRSSCSIIRLLSMTRGTEPPEV
ncbi:hypothetical protein XENTR_v10012857 [Xenopus tropicalis]|nr:hypothetical protein XENTR_v10012857 [Xenopus tropicalis]